MEFFPGAFEREWERRRAMLLHEMQMGHVAHTDWDEPRRGGVARLPVEGFGGLGRARGLGGSKQRRALDGAASRSMRTRFAALARGSQPAVVKLASYGGGARAAAMISYTSRGGELAVENERGERLLGRGAEQWAEWEHLFDNRAASRDVGVFQVTIDGASFGNAPDRDEQVLDILRTGFGDRRFVYAVRDRSVDELELNGVVVLRDRGGERLTGDRKAAEIVQQRYADTDLGQDVEARFRFHGYGNGVEWGTARVRELVARAECDVRDETGRLVDGAERAGDLVQKEWRKELHSRKGRDVMHLIVSARAGTDAPAFEAAVREFLGDRFAGHHYVFAVHDPSLDPKEMAEGGKRPHIHAHAIVTMRSETGERIETSPRVFREWRTSMAEKAREQGIDMELTDRREIASAPAYARNQVRPVSYRGRTEHEGTSKTAHARYRAKRLNEVGLAGSDPTRHYAAAALDVWNELAREQPEIEARAFAVAQRNRVEMAARMNQSDIIIAQDQEDAVRNKINMALFGELIEGKVDQMREMTRPEFEAYEKRVEAVLASVGQSLDASDRVEFAEVAAAAREVVDIRREYLDFTERQADAAAPAARRNNGGERREDANAEWDAAVARFGAQAVEAANEILIQVEHYREGLDRIEAGELPQAHAASYRAGLERELHRAAELAANDDNRYMREVADLEQAIERIEASRDERAKTEIGQQEQRGSDLADASGYDKDATGGAPVTSEAERNRAASRDGRLAESQEEQIDDRRDPLPGVKPLPERRLDDPNAERHSSIEAEVSRSDPPQQHVPRLRQIEMEFEERQERHPDDRER